MSASLRVVVASIMACGLVWSAFGSTAAATMQDGTSEIQVSRFLCEDNDRVGGADFFFQAPVTLAAAASIDATDTLETTDATDTTDTTDSTDATYSTDTTDSTDPTDSTESTEATDSAPRDSSRSTAATPVGAAPSLTGAHAFQSSGTGERCEAAGPDARPDYPADSTFTLTNTGTGATQTQGAADGGSETVFLLVAPGTYTLTDNFSGAVSEAFVVEPATSRFLEVINYFAETEGGPTPNPAGDPAFVSVIKTVCTDDARAGNVDFFVFNAQATADECRSAEAGEASFTLTADDGDPTSEPVETNANGIAFFVVDPGVYTITENETDAVSEPVEFFSGGQGVNVVNYAATAQPTATFTPTPTSKPTKTPHPPATATSTPAGAHETPHPTKEPGPGPGAVATHPPNGGPDETPHATHPPRASADETPDATHPPRASADGPAAVATSTAVVSTLPSTGDGNVSGTLVDKIVILLLGAVVLGALATRTAGRRTG